MGVDSVENRSPLLSQAVYPETDYLQAPYSEIDDLPPPPDNFTRRLSNSEILSQTLRPANPTERQINISALVMTVLIFFISCVGCQLLRNRLRLL